MRAPSRSMLATAAFLALGASCALGAGCTEKPGPTIARYDAGVQDASISDAGEDAGPAADAAPPPPAIPVDPSMPAGPSFDVDFTHRLRHLLDAITTNDAALCHDVQLPRKAYADDYATKSLVKVWDHGLDAAFKKSLGKLHRKHKRLELAFVSLEVPKAMELAPAREREGFRVPLWRVAHAKLHVKPAGQLPGDAKDTTIDLGSLVYWRGAWYVERL